MQIAKKLNVIKFKIIISFSAIILILIVLEIFMRLFSADRYYVIKHEWHNYNNRPRNSLGLRDVEHNLIKPKGTHRILYIGDSFTEAWGVQFEKSYTQILTSMLNKTYRDRKYEAIVCAEWGANALRELDIFLKKCRAYKPDLIIIGFVLNDVEPRKYSPKRKQFLKSLRIRKPEGISAILYKESTLFRMVYLNLETLRIKRAWLRGYDTYYGYGSRDFEYVLYSMKIFQEESKKLGSELLVAIFPFLEYNLGENYPFEKYHQIVFKKLTKMDIETMDTLPDFRGKDSISLQVNPGYDAHPNEFGHQIIAESIYKYLTSHPYLLK